MVDVLFMYNLERNQDEVKPQILSNVHYSRSHCVRTHSVSNNIVIPFRMPSLELPLHVQPVHGSELEAQKV